MLVVSMWEMTTKMNLLWTPLDILPCCGRVLCVTLSGKIPIAVLDVFTAHLVSGLCYSSLYVDSPCSSRLIELKFTGIETFYWREICSFAQELKIDHNTVLTHLLEVGFKKKLIFCVSHKLTPKNMTNRIFICKAFTKQNEIDSFLKRMWDWKGIIYYELLLYGQILNSDIYCQRLDRLKPAIDQKRQELANRRGVLFYQDTVRPHTSVVIRQKLWELCLEVLMLSPYSPDLVPIDYHLCSHCKTS
ncbi:histone-lysine N-methyltransferase SETMAR [Trichonephila clavipes]|uniref:Histone-lysine N-methyltransferase SETMAR n=1 Tax=Trichonephila clavipes TaxID=2585209 RepID=A0A8X7BCQ4_TRICX|nr:histone-lysine N-methyltransferase SETMAR [Trichonephila clavipes]